MVMYMRNGPLFVIVVLMGLLLCAGLLAGLSHNLGAAAVPPNAAAPRIDANPGAAPHPQRSVLPPAVQPAAVQSPSALAEVDQTSAKKPAPTGDWTNRYVTTAFYLNVRSGAGKTYKILRTVKRGTVLEVADQTVNGWLKLADGGFVHGAYARPEPVQIVSPPAPISALPSEPVFPAESEETPKPAKPTSLVRSDSGLTEKAIAEILKGTDLEGHGLESAILEVEDDYGINAFFTIAVMKLESGNGKSRLAKAKNNLFGLNATGGRNENAFRFETKADSVRKFGQLIADHYIGKGYTTIEKVARKYCPVNDKWPKLVQNIMIRDRNLL